MAPTAKSPGKVHAEGDYLHSPRRHLPLLWYAYSIALAGEEQGRWPPPRSARLRAPRPALGALASPASASGVWRTAEVPPITGELRLPGWLRRRVGRHRESRPGVPMSGPSAPFRPSMQDAGYVAALLQSQPRLRSSLSPSLVAHAHPHHRAAARLQLLTLADHAPTPLFASEPLPPLLPILTSARFVSREQPKVPWNPKLVTPGPLGCVHTLPVGCGVHVRIGGGISAAELEQFIRPAELGCCLVSAQGTTGRSTPRRSTLKHVVAYPMKRRVAGAACAECAGS